MGPIAMAWTADLNGNSPRTIARADIVPIIVDASDVHRAIFRLNRVEAIQSGSEKNARYQSRVSADGGNVR
jgi:hypothetical protein